MRIPRTPVSFIFFLFFIFRPRSVVIFILFFFLPGHLSAAAAATAAVDQRRKDLLCSGVFIRIPKTYTILNGGAIARNAG